MNEGVNPYAAPMPEMGQGDALALSLAYAMAQKQIRKEYEAENAKLREAMKRVRREIFGHLEPHAVVPKYQLEEWAEALNESEGNDE